MMYVPCGKCMPCRINNAQDWRFRLEQEMEVCSSAHFLTLTYRDGDLTRNDLGHPVLVKSDLQKFWKRLRKHIKTTEYEEIKNLPQNTAIEIPQIRYYAVGEYGEETKRPHYHAIAFNIPSSVIARLAETWKHGHVKVGTVTPASIGYVTKYVTKIDTRDMEALELTPPFNVQSQGLGANYVNDETREYHSRVASLYTINKGDKRQRLPRYIQNKIHVTEQQRAILVQQKLRDRAEREKKHVQKLMSGETSGSKQRAEAEALEFRIKKNNKRNKL